MLDKRVCVGEFGGFFALFVGCVKPAVADIFHNRAREKVGILQNHAQTAAQIVFIDGLYIESVVSYRPRLNVVKPVYKVGNRSFSRARRAYERDFLTGLGVKRNIFQNCLFFVVSEHDAVETDIAL